MGMKNRATPQRGQQREYDCQCHIAEDLPSYALDEDDGKKTP